MSWSQAAETSTSTSSPSRTASSAACSATPAECRQRSLCGPSSCRALYSASIERIAESPRAGGRERDDAYETVVGVVHAAGHEPHVLPRRRTTKPMVSILGSRPSAGHHARRMMPATCGESTVPRGVLTAVPSDVAAPEEGCAMAEQVRTGRPSKALRRALVPFALAQFICSFAGSNMNVMITDISEDLGTTVQGIQLAITIFLLVMAALMIPGGKLTDRYGRKRLFTVGLVIYGIGALISALSPGLGVLIIGNSILEGIGTALLIPPVYILTTLLFTEMTSRARAFGVI